MLMGNYWTMITLKMSVIGKWWSQRDLNPCLHLERVPSWAKLDDGTSL